MKRRHLLKTIPGALGLACLAVYVLACSSFSPDDVKVACPAFDPQTGDLGVAVYDRRSGKTEQVFSVGVVKDASEPEYEARLLRTHWLDNKRLVAAWPGQDKEDTGLNVTVLPLGGGPVRQWLIADLEDVPEKFMQPLAVAGSKLLVVVDSNLVARLDLETGQATGTNCHGDNLTLYPAGSEEFVLYSARDPNQGGTVFGTLGAGDFVQKPLYRFKDVDFGAKTPMASMSSTHRLALLDNAEGKIRVLLAQPGQEPKEISVPCKTEVHQLGNACFGPKGEVLYAAFHGRMAPGTNLGLGFLEIPLDGRPARPTFMVGCEERIDRETMHYFDISLSHDGKTIAVCTTYLMGDPDKAPIRPADCGLFLADLSKSPPAITKAPLPLPGKKFK